MDGILEGSFGALRDEYLGGKFEGWRVWWCDVVLFLGVRRLESLVV